ncbi:MAG TPA: extracellular solute-binding protein [Negativicutes bacterium]|jgi:iron(III) transport system substrate-binding protein
MRRYLPLLLIAFFVLIIALTGSTYLAGYAGEQNPETIKNITVYTTLPLEQVTVLAQEYEKSQKLRVNIVPLSEQDLMIHMKTQTATPHADVLLANRNVLEQAKQAHLLVPYTSEQTDIILERFKDKNNYWIGIWYDPIVFAVNQDYLKKFPQSVNKWSDLSQDNSRLRIGITDFWAAEASANLLYTLISTNGEAQTFAYLKKIHPQIVQYAKFLATPVRMAGMGDVDVAIAVQSETLRYVQDNFPLKVVYPEEGTAFLLTGVGLVNEAPHDADAKQFIDWLTQDKAQEILRNNKFYFSPTNSERNIYNSEKNIYKEDAAKNIKLLESKDDFTDEQKHQLLDKWVQTVRLASK